MMADPTVTSLSRAGLTLEGLSTQASVPIARQAGLASHRFSNSIVLCSSQQSFEKSPRRTTADPVG